MHGRGRRMHAGFVLLCGPLIAACTLGATWRYAAVTAANLFPVVVLVAQLWRRACPSRAGWVLMLMGTAVLAVHNLQNQLALVGTERPATTQAAAATLALGYALLLGGGAVSTAAFARRDRGGLLDAAVIGLAVASLLWALVLQPAHLRRGSSPATVAYEMSLVLLVTALAGVTVRLAIVAREVRTVTLYLLLAIVAATLADVAFTFTEDPATHLATWWASALCVIALVAFGAALAHPSATAVAFPERSPVRLTRWRLAFLGGALAANPVLAVVAQVLGHAPDLALFSTGTLVMVPLVVLRIELLARRNAEAEQRLRHLAAHDELTGLANRRSIVEHLDGLLARVADGTSPGAVVLYLDLDDFKLVNDTHGHSVGDGLLRVVAARLRGFGQAGDLVARLGGDEFVIVLEGGPGTGVAAAAAVEGTLGAPVTIGTIVASSRASVGVATVGQGIRVASEALLAQADASMYRVKRSRVRPADAPPAPRRVTATASASS